MLNLFIPTRWFTEYTYHRGHEFRKALSRPKRGLLSRIKFDNLLRKVSNDSELTDHTLGSVNGHISGQKSHHAFS